MSTIRSESCYVMFQEGTGKAWEMAKYYVINNNGGTADFLLFVMIILRTNNEFSKRTLIYLGDD